MSRSIANQIKGMTLDIKRNKWCIKGEISHQYKYHFEVWKDPLGSEICKMGCIG